MNHYIDDFVTLGRAGTSEYNHNLSWLKDVCDRMGMPLVNSGPATELTFLGMEVDSVQQIIQLPDNKQEAM